MCSVLEQKFGTSPKEMVMDAFKVFDEDGDGEVSRDELTKILTKVRLDTEYYYTGVSSVTTLTHEQYN